MSNKGGIPEEIEIGGQTIKVSENEAILALLKAARKQEKSKLYSDIQDLETQLEAAKKKPNKDADDKSDITSMKGEIAELKQLLIDSVKEKVEPKGEQKKKDAKKSDDGQLTAEQVQKIIADALAAKDSEYEQKINAVKGDLDGKKLSDYRAAQLAKYDGRIIADLVPAEGFKTQEEVDSAIEKALETSKQYIRQEYEVEDGKKEHLTLAEIEALKEKEKNDFAAQQQQRTPNYPQQTPPTPPDTGDGDASDSDLLKNVADMSEEEYEKHRDKIMRQAKEVSYVENS